MGAVSRARHGAFSEERGSPWGFAHGLIVAIGLATNVHFLSLALSAYEINC